MNRTFESLERQAFHSFWNDGLLDLMLGLVLLVMGLAWWQDVAVLGAVFPAACMAMWYPLRRRLVEPRLGFVEFSDQRAGKVRRFRFGLMGILACAMVLGLLVLALWQSAILARPAEWISGFPLILFALPAALFGLFTHCRRFLWYAFLMLLAAVGLVTNALEPYVGLLACGVVIGVSGGVLLVRFLSHYPRAEAASE